MSRLTIEDDDAILLLGYLRGEHIRLQQARNEVMSEMLARVEWALEKAMSGSHDQPASSQQPMTTDRCQHKDASEEQCRLFDGHRATHVCRLGMLLDLTFGLAMQEEARLAYEAGRSEAARPSEELWGVWLEPGEHPVSDHGMWRLEWERSTLRIEHKPEAMTRQGAEEEAAIYNAGNVWQAEARRLPPCTPESCGHMRQLSAIVDLLGMTRGTRSVLDELRSRLECEHKGLTSTFSGGEPRQAGRVQWCTGCGSLRYERLAKGEWVWCDWMRTGAPPPGGAKNRACS